MQRLIMFLIRRKLGVRKYEFFQFDNQKSDTNLYYIDTYHVMKVVAHEKGYFDHPLFEGMSANYRRSSVSLNWLMDKRCKIKHL